MNNEGNMFCCICKCYDRSDSFSVGNQTFKLVKAHGNSDWNIGIAEQNVCTYHTLHTGSNRELGLVHKQKDAVRQVNILVNIMFGGTSNSHIKRFNI